MAVKRTIKRADVDTRITVKEAFESFILEKEARNLAPKTIQNYQQSFDFFCKYHKIDDTTLLETIDEKYIYKWISSLKKNDVKPSSINHYLRDIRTFFNWCFAKEYCTPFAIKEIEAQEESLKLYTDEEIEKLLEKPDRRADYAEWRTYAMIALMTASGARADTTINMKVCDIDFVEKNVIFGKTKNKKYSSVPLSGALETVMKEYIKLWRTTECTPDSWLFARSDGQKLTYNAARLAFKRYCDRRGVQKHNLHGLRHNFAKNYIKGNGNAMKLQQILGHSSLNTTRRYVKLFTQDLKEDYDDLSLLDNVKKGTSRKKLVKRSN